MRKSPSLLAALALLASCGPVKENHGNSHRPRIDGPEAGQTTVSGWPGSCPSGQPSSAAPSDPAKPFGTDAQRSVVREWIRRLMDETRIVPDVPARKGGPRGSPGSFAKLSAQQVEEFVSAIIYAGNRFSPQSLSDDKKHVLVAAEISIESAFTPSTSGVNPGNAQFISVGPLQLTLAAQPGAPGMWDDTFKKANLPGLIHADGSPWNPADTTRDQFCNSIFDGIVSAFYCITEQARHGIPDYLGGPDGPAPRQIKMGYLAWVIGGPAVKAYLQNPNAPEADLADQRDMYLASIQTDLKMLGYDPALIETTF